MSRNRRHIRARRGVMLLETVLSLALFVMSAAFVGASVSGSLRATRRIRLRSQAVFFAQSMMAELRMGYAEASDGAEGDFAPHFPQYHYKLLIVETPDLEDLKQVTVIVSWGQPDGSVDDDPTADRVELTGWIHGLVTEEQEVDEPGSDGGAPPDSGGGPPSGGATPQPGGGGGP